ncbi:MAG: hypothetical protein H0V78_01850 [Burkholderiales bacterium]|nr:hypothetical protein [Burkholderiales bacterium]
MRTALQGELFDPAAPVSDSVALRILGKADADVIVGYKAERGGARAIDNWQNQVDWPERSGDLRVPGQTPAMPMVVAMPGAARGFVYARGPFREATQRGASQ